MSGRWTSANSGPDYRAGDDSPVTITEFLNARLGEDEAAANAVLGWTAAYSSEDKDFAERFGPARVLREVAAKRAILDAYLNAGEGSIVRDVLGFAVGTLASAWSDHADYRAQEWGS